jgi:NAD(P)-dependent dehydrogenase (short-subunit alcohol dehydrogenase family)
VSFIQTDVLHEAQVEAMIGHAVDHFGRLDCLFIDPALIVLTTRRSGTAGAGRWSGCDGGAWRDCAYG